MPRDPIPLPIKARDLRANIKDLGFEQGVVATLELLLDEHSHMKQLIREMATLLDRCIDEVMKMTHVGESMKQGMEQLKRDQNGE
jgi:hypothetical protein